MPVENGTGLGSVSFLVLYFWNNLLTWTACKRHPHFCPGAQTTSALSENKYFLDVLFFFTFIICKKSEGLRSKTVALGVPIHRSVCELIPSAPLMIIPRDTEHPNGQFSPLQGSPVPVSIQVYLNECFLCRLVLPKHCCLPEHNMDQPFILLDSYKALVDH